MHRALFISDILLEIFTQFQDQSSGASGVKSSPSESLKVDALASAARTCKTFHETAMDLLWADMSYYGINPLLGCVTRLHPLMSRHKYSSFSSQELEPLSEHEVQQFLRHAARVRSLGIWSSTEDHLHLLAVLPIGACVFPKLLSLDWRPYTNTRLHLFLSPTLRHCAMSHCLRLIHSDLEPIMNCSSVLESLEIASLSVHTTDELSLLSDTIRACKRLRHLTCPSLDYAAWEHLSNLPNLVTLQICGGLHQVLLDHDNVDFAPFLNVATLRFYQVESAADIITVIQHSEFPSLKEVDIRVRVFPHAQAEQLCHALSQCKASQTLEHIHISSSIQEAQQTPFGSLAATGHFVCFAQLRTLWFSVHHPIYLNNDLLLEAMSSWPHIRSLMLDPRPAAHHHPLPVTFRGLFSALRLCPNLHSLTIPMDAMNIDIDPEAESFQHTSLRLLDMCHNHVADPEAVARIIFSMLPSIDSVGYNFYEPNLWPEVNDFLDEFAARSPVLQV